MYIDDNNYDTAIENLDDCIWAINNMLDYTIKPRGFASKEDHKYISQKPISNELSPETKGYTLTPSRCKVLV
jgi:hypothetical protein